jgi:hypothetical protein
MKPRSRSLRAGSHKVDCKSFRPAKHLCFVRKLCASGRGPPLQRAIWQNPVMGGVTRLGVLSKNLERVWTLLPGNRFVNSRMDLPDSTPPTGGHICARVPAIIARLDVIVISGKTRARLREVFAEVLLRCLGLEPAELFGGGPLEAREDRRWGAGAFRIDCGDDGLDGVGSGIEQGLEPCWYLAIEADGNDAQALADRSFDLQAHVRALVCCRRRNEQQEPRIADGGAQGSTEWRTQRDRVEVPPKVGALGFKVGDELAGKAFVRPRVANEGCAGGMSQPHALRAR